MRFAPILLILAATGCGGGQSFKAGHIPTTYAGVEERWARAMAGTLDAARSIYVSDFGFDMPERIPLEIQCDARLKAELYTNGTKVVLHLRSASDLTQPSASGDHNIFGMCHELGHIAMLRALGRVQWMRKEANEAWAVYMGSIVVDRLFAQKGMALLPVAYDYRREGTVRLEQMVKESTGSALAAWYGMGQTIGDERFAKLFTAWSKAPVDPTNPRPVLGNVLFDLDPGRAEKLRTLWLAGAEKIVMPIRKEIRLRPALLDTYAGEYGFPSGERLAVTREGDRLYVQQIVGGGLPGAVHPKMEMFAEREGEFFVKYEDDGFTFEKGSAGQVVAIVLHKAGQDHRAQRVFGRR